MPRAPRIQVAGGIYHVCSRGNRGCPIYADDAARSVFLELLGRVALRNHWSCHAFCLMSNHYHLLVEIQDRGLSDGMRSLNGDFARFTNRFHGYEGHLFRNRFWSDFIEEESHFLQVARYIVLNPLRAGLCKQPEAWRWSSYLACAGLEFAPSFLAVTRLHGSFGVSPAAARRAYRAFVHDGVGAGPPDGVGAGPPGVRN